MNITSSCSPCRRPRSAGRRSAAESIRLRRTCPRTEPSNRPEAGQRQTRDQMVRLETPGGSKGTRRLPVSAELPGCSFALFMCS